MMAAALATAISLPSLTTPLMAQNPLLAPQFDTPFGIPPFEQIKPEHYLPALQEGIARQKQEIEAIVNNPATPTFDNTILAMEQSGELLGRVMSIFSTVDEANSTPELEAVAEQVYPLYSQATDEIMMNPKLFMRVKYLYDHRKQMNLSRPQLKAVEETYRNFTRSGALLSPDQQEQLKAINNDLATLYLRYSKNLLNATNAFTLVVDDEAQLSGLPASNVAVAAEEAAARGLEGKWVFTLDGPSRLPLLQYADNRDLRQKMYEGYTSRASSGEYDNRPVIAQIVKQRAAKAKLLGYESFAAYMTEPVMAKNPQNAEDLLMKIWAPAVKKVEEEVSEMQALSDGEGHTFKIAPWDYYYYAEKVRKAKYDLQEDEVRQYFAVDSVVKGVFTLAERNYGVTFTLIPDAPKYHPDVKVYEVKDAKGEHVAVFMNDYYPRASKRQGAWMGELQSAFQDPNGRSQRPIVYNVGNFSKPTADTPSLLTIDDVTTLFHEFGHGLHGMLTRAQLRSQAGTNTDRDFVELPSQITEHWAFAPELVKTYAKSYITGEVIPDDLHSKLQAATTNNQGFIQTEQTGAAHHDLQWGKVMPEDGQEIDVDAFEASVADVLGLPKEIQFRYRSPYFRHIFGSEGYASGYYTYQWAAVLECDGFELFKEKGVFDPETAASFKRNILEMGGSEDPMEIYVRFRGHEPQVEALLRDRGLLTEPEPGPDLHMQGGK